MKSSWKFSITYFGNSVVGFEVHVLTLFVLNYAKENNITKNQNTRTTIILFQKSSYSFHFLHHNNMAFALNFVIYCFEHASLRNIQKSSLHLSKNIHKPSVMCLLCCSEAPIQTVRLRWTQARTLFMRLNALKQHCTVICKETLSAT